jgi:hypothetical protein
MADAMAVLANALLFDFMFTSAIKRHIFAGVRRIIRCQCAHFVTIGIAVTSKNTQIRFVGNCSKQKPPLALVKYE